ncbi:hypothetical protein [Paenibacillus sp. J2TS4]|uniref:hypothetical protein n=1 Tax=Paenibacillus sp. J2TS4 TaxID=2807194 RepID=UPI001B299BCB|nr:hypothetical protein [Paenibacillus sp. J2TS4]GIP32382.1 hypothetical protein J2TS4_15920 [Paenibacillus sp. J2TS4]
MIAGLRLSRHWRDPLTCMVLLLIVVLLSGCLYSGEVKKQNLPATGEFIVLVQNAVDQFKERTGVLPIKTKDSDTPLYEKYPIDFKKLMDNRLLSMIPTNAFENGGTAIYVLIDVETKPTVKMIDLPLYQKMVEIQKEVSAYQQKKGKLPNGEAVADGIHLLDFEQLGKKMPAIQSPNTGQTLPVLIEASGNVYIDYSLDLVKVMENKGEAGLDADIDLREILAEESLFVPVWSLPYQWIDGQPQIVALP